MYYLKTLSSIYKGVNGVYTKNGQKIKAPEGSKKGKVPSILELGDGCKLCSRFEPEECACGGTKEEPDWLK
ncbi:hypothetical protein Ct9H90mP12_1290 [bacterium]|nr:MAG: hypothetical protein Ct9H90mP12_1290 [bacterium]